MTSQSRAALAFSILVFAYGCATGSDSLFEGEPGGGGAGGTMGVTGTTTGNAATSSGNTGSTSGSTTSSASSSSASSSSASSSNSSSAVSSSASTGTGIPGLDGGLPEAGTNCVTSADCADPSAPCCLMGFNFCGPDLMIPGFCL